MARHTTDGLAALCLAANGFKADSFADERLLDGRITDIHVMSADGQLAVLVFGKDGFMARGTSRVSESDARAQALFTLAEHERELAAKRPGDLVRLDPPCS